MRRALTYARPLGVRLAQHCEDELLAAGGSMNEGAVSSRLGLVGRPALAEELMVQRDIELVALTGGALHFMHLSTARRSSSSHKPAFEVCRSPSRSRRIT